MMKRACLHWICTAALAAMLAAGCGTTGSAPTSFPEVRFRVHPSKPSSGGNLDATFTAELVAGGVKHAFPANATFTATGDVDFVLENAAPPYGGTFTVSEEGSRDIHVVLSVTGVTDTSADSAGPAHAAVVGTISPATAPATNEVRFEVCVPSDNAASCGLPGSDSGDFGKPFNGSIGDAFNTHLIGGLTPSIFFLDGARDSIHAVFALAPFTGKKLIARMYLNGELKEEASDTGDVVLKQDL
ncbi:MAG TPA: hypothetical protein VF515_19965 [Candidatus Binatia bacterium]